MPYIRIPKLSGSHPLVLDDAVQVRLLWTWNGVQGSNVLGGRVEGGYAHTQSHADDLGTAIVASFTSSGLKALMASTTNFGGVGIRDLREPHLVEYISEAGGVVGTGAGDPLPNQLAACVTLRTAKAGKSYRGRTYFSGANEAQNTSDGLIAAGLATAIEAFMAAVKTDMDAEGITLAVLSAPRYANLVPPLDIKTWPGAVNDVTSIQLQDNLWDSQRRRKS